MKTKSSIPLISLLILLTLMLVLVTAMPGDFRFTEKKEFFVTENNEYVPEEIIVKFKPGTNDDIISNLNSKHGALISYTSPFAGFKRLKLSKGKTISEMVDIYRNDPNVEYAEPNYIAHALMVPNDPYYKYQWHLYNPVYGGVHTQSAWDISNGSKVIVAVIDTGIAYENYGLQYKKAPDLANTCFLPGYDFINNDAHPNDDNSHGTHVAGTIAQSTNNGIGVAGVAFGACLMPVKVLDKYGSGTYAQVADGIYYAANNNATIISLSLGGSSDSKILKDAVAYAYSKGVTIVAASGNDGKNVTSYPAAYDDYVIAVGATRYDETLAYYSNYGPSLDLVAPGGDLRVDQNNDSYYDGVLQNTFNPNTKNTTDFGYWFFQGTSMATPHVSGVAALLIAKGVTGPDNIRNILQSTAEDLGTPGRDNTYGWGLVNAYAALNYTPTTTTTTSTTTTTTTSTTTTTLPTNDTTPPTIYATIYPTTGNYSEINITVTDNIGLNYTLLYTNDVFTDVKDCTGTTLCNWFKIVYRSTEGNYTYKIVAGDTNGNYATTYLYAYYYPTTTTTTTTSTTTTSTTTTTTTTSTTTTTLPTVKCWSAGYKYLKRNGDQMKKFCKCAQGIYGYKTYSYVGGTRIAYQYVDTEDNENWGTKSVLTSNPAYRVKCINENWYNTNKDYYYG